MEAMTPPPGSTRVVPPPRGRSAWDGWGTEAVRLPPGARALIATVLSGKAHPVPRRAAPSLSPSRLDAADLAELTAIIGDQHVRTDDDARVLHLGGKSTPDLLARRRNESESAPDAVISPASHDETLAILAACTGLGVAVIPFGGGTSVVGGVHPERGRHSRVVALDLVR